MKYNLSNIKIENQHTTATANPIKNGRKKNVSLLYLGYQLLSIGLAFKFIYLQKTYPNQSSSYDIHTHLETVWFQNLNSIIGLISRIFWMDVSKF
jgi:hypothetical protein